MSDSIEDDDDEPVPETLDLTDPKSQKRARDRQRREAQEIDGLWRGVMNLPVGRRAVWTMIIQDCHGFSPPFACGPNGFPQTEATWFQAGQYSIGQRLYQRLMRMAPESVALMHAENDATFIAARRSRRQRPSLGE